ncbi:unnamed protein product [Macrosiphum euphorbiae]|uniref:Uncharacterized protein n=1 Tax=Macrosiphum euphorbiae TaxID=13131 RepID=A0AAV0W568_9HEMI|nr:unnamed protein product [Macrosiphum euphorbiae]
MTPNQVQATSDREQEGGGGEIRNHYESSAFEARRSSVKTFFHKKNSKTDVRGKRPRSRGGVYIGVP